VDSLAFKIVDFGIQLAVILFAISFHESAHAYAALRFGDTTARDLGRISLNPIRHLDPFGSVLLPLFMYIVSSGRMIFGAAKPTLVDLRNTRNPRLANLVVSAAGPVSNFFLATLAIIVLLVIKQASPGSLVELAYALQKIRFAPGAMAPVVYVLFHFALVNIALGVFNLIPIPPLDGSGVVISSSEGRWPGPARLDRPVWLPDSHRAPVSRGAQLDLRPDLQGLSDGHFRRALMADPGGERERSSPVATAEFSAARPPAALDPRQPGVDHRHPDREDHGAVHAYLDAMQELDLDVASEYVALAAELIYIKSRMLLPRPPGAPEEDPRQDLARRLLEYERFKRMAESLHEIDSLRAGLWPRPEMQLPKDGESVTMEVSLFDLIEGFRKVTERYKLGHPAALEIRHLRFSVREKMEELLLRLDSDRTLSLLDFLGAMQYRAEAVTAFLATLGSSASASCGSSGGPLRGSTPRARTCLLHRAGARTGSCQSAENRTMTRTGRPGGRDPAPRPRETRWTKITAQASRRCSSPRRARSRRGDRGGPRGDAGRRSGGARSARQDAEAPERGIRLELVAEDGARYRPEFDSMLRKYHEVSERSRLSLAALETLAIIAYRQPITLPEIQEVRGSTRRASSTPSSRRSSSRRPASKAVVGSPFLYRTTPEFWSSSAKSWRSCPGSWPRTCRHGFRSRCRRSRCRRR
jgi:Zn-dependent protease